LEEKLHFDFFWTYEISKIADRQGYDLVISMSERAAVPMGVLLHKQIRQVAVLINALSPRWLSAIKLLKAYKRWTKVVTYSNAEAQALQKELDLEPEKLQTILNYVDTEFFRPDPHRSTISDDTFFISQGLAKRDYPTLIHAMQGLPQIECRISAVSAWDKFAAGYEGLEIPDNVVLKAYDHPSFIRDVFEQCRFLVIPLRPEVGMWCSGSTSVLQAKAMGKPVIVTYLPGIAEYVKDGETGFLVEGGNPEALREKIAYLWDHPEVAEEMGQYAQEWVRRKFSLENWVNQMCDLVSNLDDGSQSTVI
jgi:glycosyltransferase involved in cell wall biosynthesis